jgi:catechol-2,3-dioxygenase
MSMIQALGNVSKVRGALIFVEDAEAELKFYRDVIGLRLLFCTGRGRSSGSTRRRARASR